MTINHYFFNGVEYLVLPDPFNGISPMTPERFVAMGGTIGPAQTLSKFEQACQLFIALCGEIGEFINDPDFRGGFDEYAVFAASDAYQENPVKGNALAIQWSALNELCKYEGAKAGYGQPDWWYRCWEMAEDQAEPVQGELF